MEICNGGLWGHVSIAYDDYGDCPLCEALKEKSKLEEENKILENKVCDLEAGIDHGN